jgi:primosomal protein N' (replication factor Y)
MAIVRSKIKDIPLILASATPSLETINNVKIGKYNKVSLTKRYSGIELPQIEIVNLLIDKPQKSDLGISWLSPKLEKEIKEYLSNKEQIMLFLNRRGYAPLKICRNCGHKMTCPHCSGFLVEHKKSGTLRCHHCNYVIKNPDICPECGQIGELVSCGPGVERIEEEVNHKFPEAKTLILTSDSQDNLKDTLDKIKNKEIDIIIGTQILAKGHNFPSFSLVGVIDADIGLIGGDLSIRENFPAFMANQRQSRKT